MKLRREAVANSEPDATREDIRDLAEALSLYRSAMQHVTDREAARPFAAKRRPTRIVGFRFLLAPAHGAAIAAAALVPAYSHFHHHPSSAPVSQNQSQHNATSNVATVDDTVLMNQIDSELSEDVPDALRPLADVSDQTTSSSSVTEKKNVTQE